MRIKCFSQETGPPFSGLSYPIFKGADPVVGLGDPLNIGRPLTRGGRGTVVRGQGVSLNHRLPAHQNTGRTRTLSATTKE